MTPMPSSPSPENLPEALRQPAVLIWAMLAGIGVAIVLALAPGIEDDRLVRFGLAALASQWIILSGIACLHLFLRFAPSASIRVIAAVSIGLLLALTAVVHAGAWLLMREADASGSFDSTALLRSLLTTLTVSVLAMAALMNHLRAQRMALRTKQAELEALHARIHPHFLFNTLNTGVSLVHARPEAAEQLLLDLADLFRAAITSQMQVQLDQEMQLVERYLSIEQLRLGDRLRVEWHLPESIPTIRIPSLSLQPLVENAIRHGIEPLVDGGAVSIEITELPACVRVRIANDAPALHASTGSSGHGIGLAAVSSRLESAREGRGLLTTRRDEAHYVAQVDLFRSSASR